MAPSDPTTPKLVGSFTQLNSLSEFFTAGPEGDRLSHLTWTFIDEDDQAFFGTADCAKRDLTLRQVNDGLKRIPDEDIYPLPPVNITKSDLISRHEYYLKRPKISNYGKLKDLKLIPQMLLDEIEVLELLEKHPHPNFVHYLGSVVKRERVIGFALERYPQTIETRLKTKTASFDGVAAMAEIQSAIKHLHSLGFAHNDLNPSNIMVKENDHIIIIDLGSSRRFGERLTSGGTRGWVDENLETSEIQNDEIALGKIRAWMQRELGG
jgi:serine/threonine protein kinase